MLPKSLPIPFSISRVIVISYGSHCSEYGIMSAKMGVKGLSLIHFTRFLTISTYLLVGNLFPALSNIATSNQALDTITRQPFDPFSHDPFRNGSAISVMSCGGREDRPELRRNINESPKTIPPYGRQGFFLNGLYNKWRSWCLFDKKDVHTKRNTAQSGLIFVSIDSNEARNLDVL